MSDANTFILHPVPPFRLDLTVWALRRRPTNVVDRWDDGTYRRVINLDGSTVEFSVDEVGSSEAPSLRVRATVPMSTGALLEDRLSKVVERSLGLSEDLTAFYAIANNDTILGPLTDRFRGLHPPRLPSVFEALVNAVSCQQLSLTVGILLLSRLTLTYGQTGASGSARAFPEPEDLARVLPDDLRKLGYSYRKSDVLIGLARKVVDGTLDLEGMNQVDDATAMTRLCQLNGVGRWSAEYVLLRGLGRLNVFPGDDVGARNKLSRLFSVNEPLDYRAIGQLVERWQPYAGLVYFHLLLDGIAASGWLTKDQTTLARQKN